VRDEQSTTYTGAIATAAEFSRRIYTEAHQRGWSRAQVKVVMGDGADWIWNICKEQFPGAIEIVDLYQRQHLWDLGAQLHPNDEKSKRRWVAVHQHLLDDARSRNGWPNYNPSARTIPNWQTRSDRRRATSNGMPNACAIPSSASRSCLLISLL
jgi:hypothetical protein